MNNGPTFIPDELITLIASFVEEERTISSMRVVDKQFNLAITGNGGKLDIWRPRINRFLAT